jgi:type IV pilus assembly protein PilA
MRKATGFTLIELMITVAIVGILVAVAVPNFIRLQARSKQSEAKANLKALFQAQKAHFQAKDVFSRLVMEVGFAPERNNRYAYFLDGVAGPYDDRTGTVVSTSATATAIMVDVFKFPNITPVSFLCGTVPGVTAQAQDFTGGAQGNVDDDATLDQWSISSQSRMLPAACDAPGNIAAGEPANEQNDVNR